MGANSLSCGFFPLMSPYLSINSCIISRRLEGVRLEGVRLGGVRLGGVRLEGVRLEGVRLEVNNLGNTAFFFSSFKSFLSSKFHL